jgi:hypothetical protein
MKENKFLTCLLALLLISCAQNTTDSTGFETIHFAKNKMNLSEYLDFRFVKLDTRNDCLIGGIKDVEAVNNKIIVLDPYKSKSVFAFDSEGRFLSDKRIVPYEFI